VRASRPRSQEWRSCERAARAPRSGARAGEPPALPGVALVRASRPRSHERRSCGRAARAPTSGARAGEPPALPGVALVRASRPRSQEKCDRKSFAALLLCVNLSGKCCKKTGAGDCSPAPSLDPGFCPAFRLANQRKREEFGGARGSEREEYQGREPGCFLWTAPFLF